MPSNVRLSETAHRRLQELAKNEHTTMQTVIERALENYRRQRFLKVANQQYAALRSDSSAWQQELDDRALWENTSADGIHDEQDD